MGTLVAIVRSIVGSPGMSLNVINRFELCHMIFDFEYNFIYEVVKMPSDQECVK